MSHPGVSALGALPTAEEFEAFVIKLFGQRGGTGKKQKPTAAVGYLKGQAGLYLVVQKGAVSHDTLASAGQLWKEKWAADVVKVGEFEDDDEEEEDDAVMDASWLASSRLKKSERTGFHAEMVVVSAMLSANNWKPKTLGELKTYIAAQQGAMIVANAQACKHCGNFMTETGIGFVGGIGAASLTGWWNPILDRVFAHGGTEWGKSVPGL